MIHFYNFSNKLLLKKMSSGIGHLGDIKWDLALCLLGVFTIVYFSLWKGIKSSGKVSQKQKLSDVRH